MVKSKNIDQYQDIRPRILAGLNKLSAPILQTLSPLGKNVIFQDQGGLPNITNDGYTIAQHIALEDPVENMIAQIVKHAAIRTNSIAGDGTSTTILLADTLIKNGFSLIDNGYNPMSLKRDLDKISKFLVDEIPKYVHDTKGKDLEYVARVSSNNDPEIAKNVSHVIEKAGLDGMVFIDNNINKSETTINEELGFMLDQGMFAPQFANIEGRFLARYDNVPVFITDKRLYYEQEVIAILQKTAEAGFNNIVIVAADFIGQAPNIFIANHTDPKVNMNILLVKCPRPEVLDDLASYLGGQVFTEKRGSLVEELKEEDFMFSQKIFSDPGKTIISPPMKKSMTANLRINALKDALSKEQDGSAEFDNLKKRIASMTNGIITLKVGAKTQPEMNEKLYRYEDAINATRNALRSGYVIGGGITLNQLFKGLSKAKLATLSDDLKELVKRYCEASLRQIAINCNKPFQEMLANSTKVVGYNALTDKYEDLLAAGIIEPSIVLKMSIESSISVAGQILSADFILTNVVEKDKE